MHFVPNALRILLRSYSQWGQYAGVLCLLLPLPLMALDINTDPFIMGVAALVFFMFGTFGRVVDQNKSGRLWRFMFLAVFCFGLSLVGYTVAYALYEKHTLPPPVGVSVNTDEQASLSPALVIPAVGDWPNTPPAPPAPPPSLPTGVASVEDFNAIAVPFIGELEGLRLTAYQDVVGVWTVCYGETKGITKGMSFSKRQCDEMFKRELAAYRRQVHAGLTPNTLSSRLPVYRDVSFVSLGYNIGTPTLRKSTAIRRLNGGDVVGSCQAATWFNKAGGRIWRGLEVRRGKEYDYCMIGAG